MLPRGLRDLGGGGEVNEAVAQVVRTALVDALPFGLAPGRSGTDFVDRGHGVPDSLLVVVTLGIFPEIPGAGADRNGGRPPTQASADRPWAVFPLPCPVHPSRICAKPPNKAIIRTYILDKSDNSPMNTTRQGGVSTNSLFHEADG